MDANFRLKSRLRGPVNKDLPLGPGFAYFVEYGAYTEFIREYIDQDEVCLILSLSLPYLLLTASRPDQNLCWLSSPREHAHQELERTACDWHGRCQLRSSRAVSPAWSR